MVEKLKWHGTYIIYTNPTAIAFNRNLRSLVETK